MVRLLCEANDEDTAVKTALLLQEKLNARLEEQPAEKRRLLYIRCDKAPISQLRGKHRAQVLMKLLVHP